MVSGPGTLYLIKSEVFFCNLPSIALAPKTSVWNFLAMNSYVVCFCSGSWVISDGKNFKIKNQKGTQFGHSRSLPFLKIQSSIR